MYSKEMTSHGKYLKKKVCTGIGWLHEYNVRLTGKNPCFDPWPET